MFTVYFPHLSPLAGKNMLHFIEGKTELGERELHNTVNGDGQ